LRDLLYLKFDKIREFEIFKIRMLSLWLRRWWSSESLTIDKPQSVRQYSTRCKIKVNRIPHAGTVVPECYKDNVKSRWKMFTRLVFGGSSKSLPLRPLRRFWRSTYWSSKSAQLKRHRFTQGCAFWGSGKQFFYILTPFSPKTQIFGRFSTGLGKLRF